MYELVIQNGKWQGRRLSLPVDKPITVGRDESCQLALQSTLVSRAHAELKHVAEGIWVTDLGSQNGTFVNDVILGGPLLMTTGDQLRIGAVIFAVQVASEKSHDPRPTPTPPTARHAPEHAKEHAPKPTGGSGANTQRAKPIAKVSDDEIADWLSDADTVHEFEPLKKSDTAILRGRGTPPASAPETAVALPVSPSPAHALPAAAPPVKGKPHRSVKEEAADIIRRHWAKVKGE